MFQGEKNKKSSPSLNSGRRTWAINTLYYLVNNRNIDRIKKDYSQALRKFCNCQKLELITLSGSIYQHILLKEKLELSNRTML